MVGIRRSSLVEYPKMVRYGIIADKENRRDEATHPIKKEQPTTGFVPGNGEDRIPLKRKVCSKFHQSKTMAAASKVASITLKEVRCTVRRMGSRHVVGGQSCVLGADSPWLLDVLHKN